MEEENSKKNLRVGGGWGVKIGMEIWRRRTNNELQELYRRPDIIHTVKEKRGRWLGHIARMPKERWAKRILFRGEIGKRRGRARKR